MTNPGSTPPGWYPAPGDPPGTHRYWDGNQWTTGPQPIAGAGAPMPGAASPFPPSAMGGRPLAEPGTRIVARLIDFVIAFVAGFILAAIFVEDGGVSPMFFVLIAIVGIAYEVVLTALKGGTPGKLIMGIGVQTEAGQLPPGWGPAAIRWVMGAIPYIGIIIWIVSLVFLFNDPEHRTVQDRVAKTRVVKTK